MTQFLLGAIQLVRMHRRGREGSFVPMRTEGGGVKNRLFCVRTN